MDDFWHFSPIFVLLKMTYLVTLFVRTVSFMFSKTRHNRQFWHFALIFVLLKVTYLVTLFDRKFSKTRQNEQFLIFLDELLANKDVNVARYARHVKCDFLGNF